MQIYFTGALIDLSDLFTIEKKIINEAEELIASESDNETPLLNEYSILLSNYKKLYRQLTRLIKINDKQSTKLTSENLILEEVSKHDALTGILNRRSFNLCFENEWNKALKSKKSIAMLIVDIDFFKKVNDTYGHQAGDEVLKKVAEVIQSSARREDDIAARYGGEEFVVLLPNVILKDAKNIGEKLRKKIETIDYSFLDKSVKLTVSIGVSTIIPVKTIQSELLFNQADKALYEAKKTGRNKLCLYTDIEGAGKC